ncbi:PH domain-containing protein [Clostridium sp. SHJSY1]|uniref:PH domain-containing protein n=1 Tax=Clostridium sp. SHJSY1 TaxID=2942483 RepID=UPI0028750D23|nr:PH domain-containing protein [Clostridium sp. SHJSY1]MDS0524337.1 PH domain-containing protein [Clostridium sp. SHJSY1]
MINSPIRNHWIVIIQNIFKSLKELWFFILLVLSNHTKTVIFISIIVFIGVILVAVKEWLNTEFYIKDNELLYKSGVFEHSKQEIPFENISTIDIGQSLLDRIFEVCTVKIDSGNVGKGTEFKIKVDYDLAERLREYILTNKKKHESHETIEEVSREDFLFEKRITVKEIIIYALTKGKLGWALGAYFAVMNFADDVENFTKTTRVKDILNSISINELLIENRARLIAIIIGMMLFIYIIVTIFSIGYEMIKFYDFSVKVSTNSFNISYGMLSKKQYSIPIDKIHALKYKQSILQQLLKIYTLEVTTIGYGDEKGEKAILYPLANKKFNEEFLIKVLPSMIFSGEVKKPPKRSLKRFWVKRIVISLLILIPSYFIISVIPIIYKLIVIVLTLLINILLGYLNYRNTSLGVTEKLILISKGSFTKSTIFIRQSSVQSIEKSQNPFQRKDGVCDYKIDLYSNILADSIKIRHMSEKNDNKLYGNLIM